jgi:hypothetical protein
MSKRIHILFVCLCFIGFVVSFLQLLAGDSRTLTAEQALVEFMSHGFEFHISSWFFFTFAFLLGTAFWTWRLRRLRHEPYA